MAQKIIHTIVGTILIFPCTIYVVYNHRQPESGSIENHITDNQTS